MIMDDKLIAVVLIVIVVVVFNVWLSIISDMADRAQVCHDKGGTMVEVTNNDFRCVQLKEIPL